MLRDICYGDGVVVGVDLSATQVLADCQLPNATPLDDPAAAVVAALVDPLGFPPLRSAVVPDDRVVIAIDRGVPQSVPVVAGIVQSLQECEHTVGAISVVVSEESSDILDGVPRALRSQLEVTVHDPSNPDSLSYLAASKEGKPIYFNKQICDADLVLPVGTLRLADGLGYFGVHSGLFPTFSDEVTQRRFRAPLTSDWTAHQRRRLAEVEEAAWLLGIQLTIQVVPSAGGGVLQVLAGNGEDVARQGQASCQAAWKYAVPEPAELVIAMIDGGIAQQTWDNFARGLFAASQAVVEGGTIAICSGLRCAPGPALRRISTSADDSRVIHDIRRDRSADAVAALVLAAAKEKARVYLLSDLDPDFVEELGVGCIGSATDLERLSRQFSSCILLDSAQHALLDVGSQTEINQRVEQN